MADDLHHDTPRADDGPEPDPVEAELIAYLDGELDPEAARQVEEKLAGDADLRERAAELKQSFDLLDFLPKPEPSPTFATRTLDQLPALKSSPAAPTSMATPVPVSSSVPVVLGSGSVPALASSRVNSPAGGWAWAFGLFLAVGAALGVGYLGTAAARTFLFPHAPHVEPSADQLPIADLRVIENLPLYAGADDLDFVDRLSSPEFFGDDAASDGPVPPQPVEADQPTGKALDALLRTFRDLPADRQQAIRLLDQQLHEQEPARRDRLLRVLEAYAAWLHRLPEAERKAVLAVTTSEKRLEAIRDARRTQWLAQLPAARRELIKNLSLEDRAKQLNQWKAEEEKARDEWHIARLQWETVQTGRQPWPFDDESMKQEVLAFAKAAYHPDDPNRGRLLAADARRFTTARERATTANDWLQFGRIIHEFSRTPRYEMLPEPGVGTPVMYVADLWPTAQQYYEKKTKRKFDLVQGRWPDFALAVSGDAERPKAAAMPASFSFGPSRPDDFKPEVKQLLADLRKKARGPELQALKQLEGKWPEYPRELIRVARAHDLSVPGAMPPGAPSLWEKTYGPARLPGSRPGG